MISAQQTNTFEMLFNVIHDVLIDFWKFEFMWSDVISHGLRLEAGRGGVGRGLTSPPPGSISEARLAGERLLAEPPSPMDG